VQPDIRAIFFDAVGTLIHPRPPAADVYFQASRRWGSRLSLEDIAGWFRDCFQAEEAIDAERGFVTSEEREVERWRRIVASTLSDVADQDGLFAELYEHFSRPSAWCCDVLADSVLGHLTARGYRLGIASNYDHRLRVVVAGLDALRSVEHLVISSEVGWRKPARQFFEAVCEAVQLPPESILYVGDDLVNDFEGARDAGLRTVLLDPRRRHPGLGRDRIDGLGELGV
jgi:putative hydrolase of the HAD superfamily